MNCKEFEKKIPEFVEGKLDFLVLQEFKEHVEQCPACKEELVIQFLVTEGMQRLEDGEAFDLQSELDARMNEARRKVQFHKWFLHVGAALEILVVVGTAAFLVWMIA